VGTHWEFEGNIVGTRGKYEKKSSPPPLINLNVKKYFCRSHTEHHWRCSNTPFYKAHHTYLQSEAKNSFRAAPTPGMLKYGA